MNFKLNFNSIGLKGNTLVVSLTEFIHDSGGHLTNPFWSLYLLALGGSLSDLALISIIKGLCGLIFHPLLGYLSDRIGRKKPIVIGGFIVAIGPLLHAFSPNWMWLIPGEILGTIDGGLWAVRQAMFADSAKQESRGVGFASLFTIKLCCFVRSGNILYPPTTSSGSYCV